MQLTYGTYSFPYRGVNCTTRATPMMAQGTQYATRHEVTVEGELLAAGAEALITAEAALIQACSVGGQNLKLKSDANTSAPSIELLHSSSLYGVRVVEAPSFPDGKQLQFAVARRFRVTFAAEYAVSPGTNVVTAYRHELKFSGGLQHRVMQPALVGDPVEQLVYPHTPYVCQETGTITALLSRPSVPGYLWSDRVYRETVSPVAPEREGTGYKGWTISWDREYQSTTALVALPTLPPLTA